MATAKEEASALLEAAHAAMRLQDWTGLAAKMRTVSRRGDRLQVIAAILTDTVTSSVLDLLGAATPWLAAFSLDEWHQLSASVEGKHFGVYHLAVYLIGYGGLRGAALKSVMPQWVEIEEIDQLRPALSDAPTQDAELPERSPALRVATQEDYSALRDQLALVARSAASG